MKQWKKPAMLVCSSAEVTQYIQANAATCLNRFLR